MLDAIHRRYEARGLEEVLAVLHWPECHINRDCTVLAARTLPYRDASNVGGYFVQLLREALRGELLVDREVENDIARAAELEEWKKHDGYFDAPPDEEPLDPRAPPGMVAVQTMPGVYLPREEADALQREDERRKRARLAAASNECEQSGRSEETDLRELWDRLLKIEESEGGSYDVCRPVRGRG